MKIELNFEIPDSEIRWYANDERGMYGLPPISDEEFDRICAAIKKRFEENPTGEDHFLRDNIGDFMVEAGVPVEPESDIITPIKPMTCIGLLSVGDRVAGDDGIELATVTEINSDTVKVKMDEDGQIVSWPASTLVMKP